MGELLCVALQDCHEIFDETDMGFCIVMDKQFLFPVLTILLFFESQVDTSDIVGVCQCVCDRKKFVCCVFALDIGLCECISVPKSV